MTDPDCIEFLQWALPRLGMRWPGFRSVWRQVYRCINRRMEELGFARVRWWDWRTIVDVRSLHRASGVPFPRVSAKQHSTLLSAGRRPSPHATPP